GGTFTGQYTINSFKADPSAPKGVSAVATLTGTVKDATGNLVPNGQITNQAVTVPVQQATGSCQILDLTLGPLHLDLLGLVIDLNQVHLQITAQQGAGNLLGNLLCAVANLLNNTNANVNAIVNLLNQILGALSGAVG